MSNRIIRHERMAAMVGLGGALCLAASGCDSAASTRHGSAPSGRSVGAATGEAAGGNVYRQMRSLALSYRITGDQQRVSAPQDIDGIVVDWGLDDDFTVTVVCMNDGAASMYHSSGGAVIGAGSHESVREAARSLIGEAARVRSAFVPVTSVETPSRDIMRFTLLTRGGLLTVDGDTRELSRGIGRLAELGNAVQRLIGAIRAHVN